MASRSGARSDAQAVIDRFVAACRADDRVLAAFLSGSRVTGTADAHSDFDFGLITTDRACEDFLAHCAAFVGQLGETLFVEDFGLAETVFFVLSDGTEAELRVGRETAFTQIARGPHRVLLDKTGVLSGVDFVGHAADYAEQREELRRTIMWFWHDVSHFIAAMSRGKLWWAYGQLEILRRACVNLLRLEHDFADPDVGMDCYFKVEDQVPSERLATLRETVCLMQPQAMLRAAHALVGVYKAVASPLAAAHGLSYPNALERTVLDRLDSSFSDSGAAQSGA